MLIDFFLHLRERRLPVSTTEYLALLEALSAGLANCNLDDFYSLARICLVKNETHYDRFDQAFGEYFESYGEGGDFDAAALASEALRPARTQSPNANLQTRNETLELAAPTEKPQTPAAEEEEQQAANGERPLANAGNSPQGDGGMHMGGLEHCGVSLGKQRAVKAWNNRQFKGLDDAAELGTRNLKLALRRLRKFAREGAADEFDLENTIASTAKNGGWLDIKMRAERRNKVKVLILFDTSGSMESHVRLCQELFSAARSEFKHIEFFYFNNCIYETVWRYSGNALLTHYPLHYLMHKYGKDYKLIIVGDASMSPMELAEAGHGLQQANRESGASCLRQLLEHYRHTIWLNPEMEQYWHLTQSIQMLRQMLDGRMFPLTLDGIDRAMRRLS